jgi:DNA-binding SARP family transcriptional activator
MIQLRTLGTIGLGDGNGGYIRAVLAQPKRLAVLALLALSRAGLCSRDRLLGLFWADSSTELARAALRQTIRFLRRELGRDAIKSIGIECLTLDTRFVNCDAREFDLACDEQRFDDALQLYQGDFLPGLFVPTASPEFDNWLEAERERLRERALGATTALVARCRGRRDLSLAAQWSRRAMALAPDDECLLRTHLELLSDAGDCVGAVRAYESFAILLHRELAVAPSLPTQRLAAVIRSRAADASAIVSNVA